MSEIQSHPHLTLAQHLEQIRQAAAAIWGRHSSNLLRCCAEPRQWFENAVCLHDAGKASRAFQKYIADPPAYHIYPKDTKAHTPLSTVCTLEYGAKVGWAWHHTLAVSQIAAGHHSEFKTYQDLERAVSSDRMVEVLGEQIKNLDWDALERAIGVVVPCLGTKSGLEISCKASEQIEELVEQLHSLSCTDGVRYRLLCQLAFSVLLEADKAFLAVPEQDLPSYLESRTADLRPEFVEKFIAGKDVTQITPFQQRARQAMFAGMVKAADHKVHTMTLPTGSGKTLLATSWALTWKEKIQKEGSPPPLVLIVLPFLAIIDQTAQEYQRMFAGQGQPGEIITYHSLSDRTFSDDLEEESQDFFLDTWQSDVVITTFDQFLFALLSPKARHQMRFHHLADALIVMDEVQALPCILWNPLCQVLDALSGMGTTRVLAMSATQPGFLPAAQELIEQPESFFTQMKRYRLVLRHRNPIKLSAFINECNGRLPDWKDKRVLLTLNTRRSAKAVRNALEQPAKEAGLRLEFLTADVTPADRLEAIRRIKEKGPCLVVSTQCIEAGVDIDMDFVIRDFAPLDSLIQVAGRCNRFNLRDRGTVEIVSLLDDDNEGKCLAGYVYNDKILLPVTAEVLRDRETINEEDVFPIVKTYFERLAQTKDKGESVTHAWARWEELDKSVRQLLRGETRPQVSFVVIAKDPNLVDELDIAKCEKDRWVRRRALKRLAGRIAQITVSVPNPGKKIEPSDFANPYPPDKQGDEVWFWLLKEKYYTSARGIEIQSEHTDDSWGIIL